MHGWLVAVADGVAVTGVLGEAPAGGDENGTGVAAGSVGAGDEVAGTEAQAVTRMLTIASTAKRWGVLASVVDAVSAGTMLIQRHRARVRVTRTPVAAGRDPSKTRAGIARTVGFLEPTPIAKILPPSRPAGYIARPGLEARVSTVLERRLTVLVAEAGFGKSTLLTTWWEAAPCAWYTADRSDRDLPSFARRLSDALRLRVPDLPHELDQLVEATSGPEPEQGSRADALASRLAGVLHEQLGTDLVLIVDDMQELIAGSPSSRLVEALCRHAPPGLRLVLSGRGRPPFPIERLRGRGQLLEITADQLAFTSDEVAKLVEERLGSPALGIAGDLHRLAGGWPAAVVLAIEALRDRPPATWGSIRASLDRPHAPVYSYLAEEVFAHHRPEARAMIGRLALLDSFTPELCEKLVDGGSRAMADLMRPGLFVEPTPGASLALRPLIRDYALENLALSDADAADVRLAAARWHLGAGHPPAAVDLMAAAGALEELAGTLVAEGDGLMTSGHVVAVLDACQAVPARFRTAFVERLEGEARQVQGDWAGALACFEHAARGLDRLPAALAWRMGVIHYLRGDLDAALDVYRRGLEDTDAATQDTALLLAWMSTVYWVREEVEPCRELSTRALAAATTSGDRRALAAAHTVMAMLAALDGDRRRNDEHYLLALRAAEQAPDVLQTVRIRTNRASHFMEEGAYPEALQELEVAVRLAELTSFASFLALSLSNRGETKLRMGQLDEAFSDLETSRTRYLEIGSDMVAYPVTVMGEVYRERGNLTQARAAFEEAIAISEKSGDVQGLVPALAGLATVLAGDEPERARELAARAIGFGTGMGYVGALVAGGWVAATTGDDSRAGELAAIAMSVARARHDRAGLADALALAGAGSSERRLTAQRLAEAAAVWREIGNPLGEAKVELALASIDTGPVSAARRGRAVRQLESLGVSANPGGNVAAGLLAFASRSDPASLRIQTLGGCGVLRGGHVVRVSEWQSKRARELLKVLVARRGRPAPRPYLMETLWPGEDPNKLANRLSVALTTVRSVLDPQHRLGPEAFVVADRDSVGLDRDSVDIDLEQFLASTREGLACLRRGETERAIPILEDATVAYAGDFLEENPYDDWATPAREEARAAYVAAARALARHATDPDVAVPHYLRVLEIDRYDEQAHLGLVSALADAGRHGEAHRHYLNYRRAMDDLSVEPAPFPGERRDPKQAPASFRLP